MGELDIIMFHMAMVGSRGDINDRQCTLVVIEEQEWMLEDDTKSQ